MPSLRRLLAVDPFLPPETREAIARGEDAREQLVALGVNHCEAAELLGDDDAWGLREIGQDARGARR